MSRYRIALISSTAEVERLIGMAADPSRGPSAEESPAPSWPLVHARTGGITHAVAVYDEERLSLVLPYVPQTLELPCRLGYATVASFRLAALEIPGPAFAGAREPEALELALAALLEKNPNASLYLSSLPEAAPVWRLLRESPGIRRHGWTYLPYGSAEYWLLKLEPDFDSYLSRFSGRSRRKLQNTVRRLESVEGEVSVRRIARADEVPPLLQHVERVSHRSWQGTRLRRAVRASREMALRLTAEAERGWLRSYVLLRGKEPISFVLGRQVERVYYYDQVGYDPEWSDYSPGKVLLYRLLEDLHQHDPPEWLDFGYGDAEYKRFFGTHHERVVNTYLLRKRPRPAVALSIHATCAGTSEVVRSLLERFNLRSRARRLLRGFPAARPGAPGRERGTT
ncbi:MAG: GNAT family N-acetyltransferase [Armatimonadota bacterium]